MSMPFQIQIECPNCGQKQEVTLWKSINSTVDPELKQALFQGKINVLHCTKCAHEGNIAMNFIYHDMEKKFWVAYIPYSLLENENMLKEFSPSGQLISNSTDSPLQGSENGEDAYFFQPMHFVFTMQELLCYIAFRDKLFQAQNPIKGSLSSAAELHDPVARNSNESKHWWQRIKNKE